MRDLSIGLGLLSLAIASGAWLFVLMRLEPHWRAAVLDLTAMLRGYLERRVGATLPEHVPRHDPDPGPIRFPVGDNKYGLRYDENDRGDEET